MSIKYDEGKRRLRGPARLRLQDQVFVRALGLDLRKVYERMTITGKGNQILDSLVFENLAEGIMIIITADDSQHGIMLHASISLATRNPTWEEIKALKEAVYGNDADAMMVLPAAADYVNLQEHTFHLWSMPAAWKIR